MIHSWAGDCRLTRRPLNCVLWAYASGVVLASVWLSARAYPFALALLGWIAMVASAIVVAALVLSFAPGTPRSRQRQAGLVAVAAGVIVSVALYQWPLRLAFAASRASIDALANQVENGRPTRTPRRVGLFIVRAVEINDAGVACFWTDLDPAGKTGFVHCPSATVEAKFNLFSSTPVAEGWQFISED